MSIKTYQQPVDHWLNKWFAVILFIGIAVNASGLLLPILGTDGALYAHIAKTMAVNNDFQNLYVEGKDWLDKPHFPFWITAVSFKIFGINSFAYKLPGLLFWALGLFYTYRFTRLFYNGTTAKLSVIIYMTAEHLILSNNDVRAEPFLVGLLIGSIYHFYKSSYTKLFSWHLLLGSLFAACAIMTKGPFILIPIVGGFMTEWIIKKDWDQFLKLRWYIAVILTFILITPELYALYYQFNMHPEKTIIVGNESYLSISGIKFFLWDSQFGRFFNTGPIKGEGDPFFFVHTLLWAFLPWSLLMFSALYRNIKSIIKNDGYTKEYISLGASLLTILLFSLSKFQLPHYTNIIFPFLSILTAHFVCSLKRTRSVNTVYLIQIVIGAVTVLLLLMLIIFFRPPQYLLALAWIVLVVTLSIVGFGKKALSSAIGLGVATSILLNIFLNGFFYGPLMQYQSGMKAAQYINENNTQHLKAGEFANQSYHFIFYLRQPGFQWKIDDLKNAVQQKPVLLLTEQTTLDSLNKSGLKTKVLQQFEDFRVAMLTKEFINKKTSSEVTRKMVVAEIDQ